MESTCLNDSRDMRWSESLTVRDTGTVLEAWRADELAMGGLVMNERVMPYSVDEWSLRLSLLDSRRLDG